MTILPDVSLNPSLATFLSIHRAGSISVASEDLHLSQPAVTRRLQALERQLRAPLFERTTGGLRLSPIGQALLPHAERAVAAERDGLRAVSDHLDGSVGTVTIAIVGSLVGGWFSDVLAAVVAEHPTIDLVVSTATSSQIHDQVRRGDVAVGISYSRPSDPALRVTVAFHEAMVVVGSAHHPCARRPVSLADLRSERWLMFPQLPNEPESSGTIARNLLDQQQIPSDRIRPIDSLSAQRALARAGYGLAFVPASTVADDVAAGELAVIDVSDANIVTPVTIMTRRDAYRSPANAMVLTHLDRPGRSSGHVRSSP
jgi:DNA-binding transcriptional LysR family regulator